MDFRFQQEVGNPYFTCCYMHRPGYKLVSHSYTFSYTFSSAYIHIHTASLRQEYTGRFIMFSVITNIYNKKTKGSTLMELFTAAGKLKKVFFTTRDVRCVTRGAHIEHL